MPTRSPARSAGMPALLLVTLTGFTGYAALLPVAPLWAVRGGADPTGAGAVNAVMLLTTVLAQSVVPATARRFGWGPVFAGGLLLLGAPGLFIGLSDELAPLLAWSAVRGIGFGALTVGGSSAVAALNPPHRRGAAIGVYGLAVAAPNVLLLPLGPWLAETFGFGVVFAAGAVPLLGVPAGVALGRALERRKDEDEDATTRVAPDGAAIAARPGTAATLRALAPPTLVLLSATLAGGSLLTFLPQMVEATWLATAGLFVLGVGTTLGRWRVGALADARGARPFVAPLLALLAAGLAGCAAAIADPTSPPAWLLLLAVAALGVAYGALQNLTLVLAFEVVPRERVGTASAVWNVGFDAGTGLASLFVGAVATAASFGAALWALAAVALLALPLARHRPDPTTARGAGAA